MAKFDGKVESVEAAKTEKPTFDKLMREINVIIGSIKAVDRPAIMPTDPVVASSWFLKQIEPQRYNEKAFLRQTKDGEYYIWPYAERVKHLLRLFMSATPELQKLIVDMRNDNIYWRGDTLDEFQMVIDEYRVMREIGIAEYRKQAIIKMKSIGL